MAALEHENFKRAAQQGHIGAVFELALQFERGIGTAPDMKRAPVIQGGCQKEPNERPVQSGHSAGGRQTNPPVTPCI